MVFSGEVLGHRDGPNTRHVRGRVHIGEIERRRLGRRLETPFERCTASCDVPGIAELIHYHLVLAEPDDESADRNLSLLAGEIQNLATRPLWQEATWVFRDLCGCSVDTELIHSDGAPLLRQRRLLLRRLLGDRRVIT